VAVVAVVAMVVDEAEDRAEEGWWAFYFFRPRALLKNRTAGRPASQPCTCACVCTGNSGGGGS